MTAPLAFLQNFGMQELILLMGGLLCVGLPVGIVLLVVYLVRRRNPGQPSDTVARLADENRHLREEIDRSKRGQI